MPAKHNATLSHSRRSTSKRHPSLKALTSAVSPASSLRVSDCMCSLRALIPASNSCWHLLRSALRKSYTCWRAAVGAPSATPGSASPSAPNTGRHFESCMALHSLAYSSEKVGSSRALSKIWSTRPSSVSLRGMGVSRSLNVRRSKFSGVSLFSTLLNAFCRASSSGSSVRTWPSLNAWADLCSCTWGASQRPEKPPMLRSKPPPPPPRPPRRRPPRPSSHMPSGVPAMPPKPPGPPPRGLGRFFQLSLRGRPPRTGAECTPPPVRESLPMGPCRIWDSFPGMRRASGPFCSDSSSLAV